MITEANWISAEWTAQGQDDCPVFSKIINVKKELKSAKLSITALGVYEAVIDNERVGEFYMAPGWTNYAKRLQYQTYDITSLLHMGENCLEVLVGNGWFRGGIAGTYCNLNYPAAIIAEISLVYSDSEEKIYSDESWKAKKSNLRLSDIYNGEIYDATYESIQYKVICYDFSKTMLIPQEGEIIREHEILSPVREILTPRGERVLDFGQEITGIIKTETDANHGEIVDISFAEMLDKDGNFYVENYRNAKSIYQYICKDRLQTYKNKTVFYGFRYIRINRAPQKTKFYAVATYSDITRSGWLYSGNGTLNKLFENIIWSQKGNFLDIPTDCPQRDERLGWTGDAQIFCKTAMYQFDTKKFFTKWLADMRSAQRYNGEIPQTIPEKFSSDNPTSAAWGDAAVIIPWTLYEMYGDISLLRKHFPMMHDWITYIENATNHKNLWTGHFGFGDWLALDGADGDYKGLSSIDFISSAFYKYSVSLTKKAALALGLDASVYEKKENEIRKEFIKYFRRPATQTEYVLSLCFDLTDNKAEYAQALAKLIEENGVWLNTGFVGTPYVLFALSENGYTSLAYSLLLREEYPSWLYSVKKGATTIWEHWDGVKDDGTMWSSDMNSFNHYVYGAVAGWVFSVAGGILINESGIELKPNPDRRLGRLKAVYNSVYGKIVSSWEYKGDEIIYCFEVPVQCKVTLNGDVQMVEKGIYTITKHVNEYSCNQKIDIAGNF